MGQWYQLSTLRPVGVFLATLKVIRSRTCPMGGTRPLMTIGIDIQTSPNSKNKRVPNFMARYIKWACTAHPATTTVVAADCCRKVEFKRGRFRRMERRVSAQPGRCRPPAQTVVQYSTLAYKKQSEWTFWSWKPNWIGGRNEWRWSTGLQWPPAHGYWGYPS